MKKYQKFVMSTGLLSLATIPLVAVNCSINKGGANNFKIARSASENQVMTTNELTQNINLTVPYTKSAANILSSNNRYHAGLNREILPFEIAGGQVLTFNFDRPITNLDDVTITISSDAAYFDVGGYYSKMQVNSSTFNVVGEVPVSIANIKPGAPRSDKYFCFIENHGANQLPITIKSVSSTTAIHPLKIFSASTDDFDAFVAEENKTHEPFVIRGQYIDMLAMRDWVRKNWDTEVKEGLRPFKDMMADMEARYRFEMNYVGLDNDYDGTAHYGPEKVIMAFEGNGSGQTFGVTDKSVTMFEPAIAGFLLAKPGFLPSANSKNYAVLHELAHVIAPAVPYSSSMGESYAEWISLETFRIMHKVEVDNKASWFYLTPYFNNDPSIIPPAMTKPIDFNFLGNYNYNTEYNHNQETMFWQLEDAFGPNLFPDLFEILRPELLSFLDKDFNMYSADWTGNIKKEVYGETQNWNSMYVTTIAKLANRDLTNFFKQWKVQMTQKDIDYMHTLPPMNIDLANVSLGEQIRSLDHEVPKYKPTSMKIEPINKIYSPFIDINNQTLNQYFTGQDIANVDRVLTFRSETEIQASNSNILTLPVWLHKSANNANEVANSYYDTLNVNYHNGAYIPSKEWTPFLKMSVVNNKIIFTAGSGTLNQAAEAIYQYKIELIGANGNSKQMVMINSIDKAIDIINNTTLGGGWDFAAGDKLIVTPLSVESFNTFDQNLNPVEHYDATTFTLQTDSLE